MEIMRNYMINNKVIKHENKLDKFILEKNK